MPRVAGAAGFSRAKGVLDEAVSRRVFPGAAAEAGGPGGPAWQYATGTLSYDASSPPATIDTVYDLASLTKVLCTTTLVMRQAHSGRLPLETPLSALLPAWRGGGRDVVTLADLLAHASGLPAWLPLYETCAGRAQFERAIAAVPLAGPPRSVSVYSDLGFMLLGFVLEDVGGTSLARQFEALEADGLGFGVAPGDRARTAPTQQDEWRGRLLRGEVDDRNAHALGGTAGHAGLFGTIGGVGMLARRLMQGLEGEEAALGVTPDTLRAFVTRVAIPGSSRALGWDTMLPTSSCGSRMSPRAFGHTGFTGTSLWIDPEKRFYAVLLSNRIHPKPGDPAEILAVRQAFHDALAG
ncbi:MAG TPA: serine hydrolase domain-containing protein [Vicinamibacterales bacterium]|nr:beta-lactamase family protein [Acidobacteriota bacterium]HOC18259.1 serine hydrolase domain-containing protein [Vicinamibacterales bacterium]